MEFKLLSKEVTRDYCNKILMPEGATEYLLQIVDGINSDKELFRIYEEFYTSYIDSGYWTTVWEDLKIHEYVNSIFGKQASLFYLHAALERLPLTEKRYADLQLEDAMLVDTLRDIGVWVQNAYNLVGYYCFRNFSWIWRHLEAKLFRIGRLQYMARPCDIKDVMGFYNKEKGLMLLLCNNGIELRANGDMQGVCGKEKTTDGFITHYEETGDCYIGNPVIPYGKGFEKQVALKKSEWEKVLDNNSIMLELHIPKDGKMDMDNIKASYEEAKAFYAKHFPELDVKGMMCHTWLFTPQLQEMLPETANIPVFQRQFYLYPTKGSLKFLWQFVFDELTEVKDAKPDSFLKKKVLEYINDDKEIYDMRGVFLDVGGNYGDLSHMDKYDAGKYKFL